jgi:hypothetical protein
MNKFAVSTDAEFMGFIFIEGMPVLRQLISAAAARGHGDVLSCLVACIHLAG